MAAKLTEVQITNRIDRLRSQGFLILEDFIDLEQLERINRELEPWLQKTPNCQGDFYGWRTTRFGSILTKAPSCIELVGHPDLLSIAEAVLGPYCDWFQLNLTQVVRIHPGSPKQPPHRDEEMWPCAKNNEFLINVMFALDDFHAENGATLIWPRSHFSPPPSEMDDQHAVIAEMKKGSALVFLGSVTHCGGANVSRQYRTGLIVSYCLGWLKQYENQFLAYPPDVAKHLPRVIQDLLGYRIHRPNLGGYENQCPSILFKEDRPKALPAIDALPKEVAARLKKTREKVA